MEKHFISVNFSMAVSPVHSLSLDGQAHFVMNKEFFTYSLCLQCPTLLSV